MKAVVIDVDRWEELCKMFIAQVEKDHSPAGQVTNLSDLKRLVRFYFFDFKDAVEK